MNPLEVAHLGHEDEDEDLGSAPTPTSPSVSPDRSATDPSPSEYHTSVSDAASPAGSPLSSSVPSVVVSRPIYIDSDTKEALRKMFSEDVPYLLANNMNGPTFTLYHIQKHIKSRCPTLVQAAKDMGNLHDTTLSHLVANANAGAETAGGLVNAAAHLRSMNSKLRDALADKNRFC